MKNIKYLIVLIIITSCSYQSDIPPIGLYKCFNSLDSVIDNQLIDIREQIKRLEHIKKQYDTIDILIKENDKTLKKCDSLINVFNRSFYD